MNAPSPATPSRRRQGRAVLAVLLVLAFGPIAGLAREAAEAKVTVSLSPGEAREANLAPLAPAVLTVENHADAPLRSVELHDTRGGATFLYRLAVAPGQRASRTVLLPATWLEQTYTARFLARPPERSSPPDSGVASHRPVDDRAQADTPAPAASDLVGVADASCSWPSEWVAGDAWIARDLYDDLPPARAAWPASLRRGVLLVGVGGVLGMAIALLPRRAWARAAVFGGVVVAASATLLSLLAAEPTEVRWPIDSARGRVVAVAARRTQTVELRAWPVVPLYATRDAVGGDAARIIEGVGVRAAVSGGEVRLLARPSARPAGRAARGMVLGHAPRMRRVRRPRPRGVHIEPSVWPCAPRPTGDANATAGSSRVASRAAAPAS